MLGVLLPGGGHVEVTTVPDPSPGSQQVVVEVRAAAFCGCGREHALHQASEAERGAGARTIAGHQAAGTVVAIGDQVSVCDIGDRVVIHPYSGCGSCERCQAGWPQYCSRGGRRLGVDTPGCWAEYVVADAAQCRPIPDSVSFELAALAACSASTAYHALTRTRTSALDTVLVYNVGSLGLCASALAVALGARLLVVEPDPLRRRLATEIGADTVLDGFDDAVPALLDLTAGEGVDVAFDPTATELSRDQCVRGLSRWGRYCIVGEAPVGTLLETPLVIRRQIDVLGVWSSSRPQVDRLLRFIDERKAPVQAGITHRLPLRDAAEGYRLYDSLQTGMVILEPDRPSAGPPAQ